MLESVLASVLNRFLASYVDGLNTSQLNVGIWSGDVKLRNLRLKKSALDKFRLPIDVKEGYLGDLTLSIPWSNLKGKPVRVLVENVYILAAPRNSSADVDEEEEEERAQAAKQEKLANAELLGRDAPHQAGLSSEDVQKNESFTSSLVTKIVDNLQITVRNIHIRYEDDLSNPEHPFSAGLTLAEFSAVSTDSEWNPTFIQSSTDGIHKLARLESLAAYWDTDAESLAGYSIDEAQEKFKALIAREGHIPSHQFILSPVSGAGRLVMRKRMTPEIAKMDAELLFDQLGFTLDDEQYRDIISVTDLFHFFTRQAQYRRFRPHSGELEENRPRAMLQFAGRAILNEVHEKHKVWSWDYFRQRRDDRKEYVRLFKEKEQQVNKANQKDAGVHTTQSEEGTSLRELEHRLSYKDIRFYRSIARNELQKERMKKKKEDAEHPGLLGGAAQKQGGGGGGWLGWIWGGGGQGQSNQDGGMLNDQQKKELYDAIEWDEESGSQALTQAVELPAEAMKLRMTAKLQKGSFALRDHSKGNDIISLVFDSLQADVAQRVDNFLAGVSLGGLRVYDGTLPNSLYPQIVRVKDEALDVGRQQSWSEKVEEAEKEVARESDPDNPFFSLQFENKPLDKRADNALTLRMRSLEIIYHRIYVESIVRFFKPPESELELIGALIDVASETLEGIRKETRAGLENALENHKTIDIDLDVKAPIIIVPEDASRRDCQHIVLDAGQISLRSVLADQSALDTVRSKQSKQYTEEDYKQLEDLMYDRFFVKLDSAQLVMGPNLKHCMKSISGHDKEDHALHLLERINLDFTLHNSILPKAPNLTKFKMTGHLPLLRVNFSDRKYKTLMAIIDAAIPTFDSDSEAATTNGEGAANKIDELTATKEGDQASASSASRARDRSSRTDPSRESMSRSASTSTALNLSKERRSRIASQMRGDEYVVETAVVDDDDEDATEFKDAEDATADRINAHQKTFELSFVVDSLQGSIYKSNSDPKKPDRLLVEANFEGFLLSLAVLPYHMEVEVGLRSLELEDKIVDPSQDVFKYLITSKTVHDGATKGGSSRASSAKSDKDLVRVKYTRVDTDSPEFMTKYEGIDQSINVEVSTINITLTRVSILAVYDWIMTTFVPPDEPAAGGRDKQRQLESERTDEADQSTAVVALPPASSERKEKLRVRVKLTSIVLRLNNDGQLLSTMTLSTADVAVLLRGNTLRVAARLGSLLLLDNSTRASASPQFQKLLTIDGDELADFTYETFDSTDEQTYPGYDMSIWLRTGSLRFTFLEEPIADLLRFFSQFAQMKAVYDAATEAASAQATQLQSKVMKIHYDVIIKTPIVVLPRDISSADMLTANLGEIYAHNTFHHDEKKKHVVTKVSAGIRHIRLASRFISKRKEHHIQMIDDVNINVDISQQEHVDHAPGEETTEPDMQIVAKMSDVQIKLTEQQYSFIMKLTQSIPKAFAFDDALVGSEGFGDGKDSITPSIKPVAAITDGSKEQNEAAKKEIAAARSSSQQHIDMLPELGTGAIGAEGETVSLYTSLDLVFNIETINVELFSAEAIEQETMHKYSLARFALNGSEVKVKMLSDSSMEAEVLLKSFNVSDTRPNKETRFREIVPAVKHDGHQFMLSYTMAGGNDGSALALVTVDSPKVIFSLDPLFALVNFFMSAFTESEAAASAASAKTKDSSKRRASKAPSSRQVSASKPKTTTSAGADGNKPNGAVGGSSPSGTLAFRINVVDPTIILLANPESSNTLAIVLSIRQVLMSQQGILALKVDQFGMFMCSMDRPKDTLRLIDNFDVALSLDSRPGSETLGLVNTNIEINVDPIVLRVSTRDLMLISDVINKAIELSNQKPASSGSDEKHKAQSVTSSTAGGLQTIRSDETSEAPSSLRPATALTRQSSHNLESAELLVSKEMLKADFRGLQLILIGDVHSLPLLDCCVSAFHVEAQDWSADLRAMTSIDLYINYYNLNKSHWEPLIDPWTVNFSMESKAGSNDIVISSKKRLELNVTTTLIEAGVSGAALLQSERDKEDPTQREHQAQFKIRNRTGYRLSLWSQQEDGKIARHGAQHLDHGHDMPWRFGDWKLMREHILESSGGGNELSVHIEGMPWERIKHLSVDQEGEKVVNLRPKLDKVTHRLLCEVKVENFVKVITLRSTFNIENNTLVPIEFVILDSSGSLTNAVHKIAPGQSCPVPIEAAYHNQLRLRPDPGFEYGWSNEAVGWQDLIKRSTRVMTCNDSNDKEAPFRFQCYTLYDRQDPAARTYPRLTLRVRAPVEVENLLPYDIQYRIFDKNHNRNWSSFLRKGGISPIHVVDLAHLLLLSVDIQSSVFSPSEFAIIATDNGDDFPVEKFLTLADSENLKLQLRLHYHRYPDSGGAFKVQIYSPYIFVNLTGLPFSLKTKSWIGGAKLVAGQDLGSGKSTSHIRKEPEPFLFSHNTRDRRNRVQLRVGDSGWSRPTSFEAVGSETELVIPSLSKNEEIHLGLTIEEGLGKFKLSKVVKLTPRYLVRNNLGEEINLREIGAADFVTASTGKLEPLHFLRVGASRQMCLAYPGLNNKWTAPFKLEDIGKVHLRIARSGHQQHLIKVEVLLEGPTIFISLEHEKGSWPFMLRNESDYIITFMQAVEKTDASAQQDGSLADETVGKRYELKPRSKMKYAWDYPAMSDKIIKLVANGKERNVNILEIGSLLPFKFPSGDGRGNRVVALDVRADGPTQTLVLSNWTEANSNYKLKRQNSTFSRSDSMRTDAGFEAVDVDTKIIASFNVELEGVGISLINRAVQELAYISFRGLEFHYSESEVTTAFNVICKWIQIDNQLFTSLFPIVLYPAVIAPNQKDLDSHPTLQASLIRSKDDSHGVTHIKYASFLLQEVTVEVDEDFLFACLDFAKLQGSQEQSEQEDVDFTENPRQILEPQSSSSGVEGAPGNQTQDVYIGILHLQPLAINLSIVRSERSHDDATASSQNPLFFLLNAASMTVGSLADAPIRLSALVIENVRLSPELLVERVTMHYTQAMLFQLYRLVGSIDVLGNPVSLFNTVSGGALALFYEPYQGLVMHGNHRELGMGLARGASTAVKSIVFGLSDSASKVTGSISQGLASATMDREFQARRRMTKFRNKPRHALLGLTAAGQSFFTSVTSGVEGLALRPLEGAEQNGAAGFVTGIGKALVGLATKPMVGLFDAASNITEGVRNTTALFEKNEIDRARLPRFIASDGIVRPYSDREALGQMWLKNVDEGRLMKDHYVAHVDVGNTHTHRHHHQQEQQHGDASQVQQQGQGEYQRAGTGSQGDNVVLLTVSRILFVRTVRMKVAWEVLLSDLSSISLESEGIALILRGNLAGPFLPLRDVGSRNWLFKQISRVVQSYNAAHQQ